VPRIGNKWDQRIDRARELAAAYPFSAEILLFYSKLTAFQKSTYLQFQSSGGLLKKAVEGGGFSPAAPIRSTEIFENVGARFFGGAEAPPFSSLPTALDEVDLGVLVPRRGPFLSMVASEGPASLAEFARSLSARDPGSWTELLRAAWPEGRSVSAGAGQHRSTPSKITPPCHSEERSDEESASEGEEKQMLLPHLRDQHDRREDFDRDTSGQAARAPRQLSHFECFCAQAFLQPYAELLADQADMPTLAVRRPTCPFCGSPPLVGVLRQEGDGAKRSLVCSFCRTEWDYLRIACPACEESREEKLRVYTTSAFDCVRVDACETCRAYIKTIDLTQNGLAVPEVDELATTPLSLWAGEQGYKKVTGNIIGL